MGLGGKGIIDIAIATNKENMEAVSKHLQKLGYEFRPTFTTSDRFYFIIRGFPLQLRGPYLSTATLS